MRLRLLIALVLAGLPASCFLWRHAHEPNLLLIVVDSLRFDAISRSLGSARTPNLQALAADGVSMTGCFAHSPISDPALAAILSSRMPHQSGVVHDGQAIESDLPLLADELADDGYQTFASLSRDLTTPTDGGPRSAGLTRGFQRVHIPEYDQWPADDVQKAARELLSARDPAGPWFLFAHFSDPQEPYEAYQTADTRANIVFDGELVDTIAIADTAHWKREFDLAPGKHRVSFKSTELLRLRDFKCISVGEPLPTVFVQGSDTDPAKTVAISIENTTKESVHCTLSARVHDAPTLAQARERYRLEVEHVDRAIGALIDELKSSGQYDDTCIVLTATHGESLGEHGLIGARTSLYDEVLRVPLIIKPLKDDASLALLQKKRNTLMRQIDLAPTILALLDAGRFPGAEGSSILKPGERFVIAETRPPEAPSRRVAMRDDRYKLIYDARDHRFEMFDLRVDTLEVENIFMLQGHLRIEWQSRLRQLTFDPKDALSPKHSDAESETQGGEKPVETSALR